MKNHNGTAAQTKGIHPAQAETEILPRDKVLIVGGGPVGLNLATVLAHYGVKSIVLERNSTTTRWPKMDLTNVRSMELFRRLGLDQGLRKQGVSSHITSPVLMSTGLSQPKPITKWIHPSVDEYRVQIAAKNDGTMPIEPYQRISQAVFESWLKGLCDENPLIDLHFGFKAESVEEFPGGAKVTAVNEATGLRQDFISRYVVGCDGASSRVRRSLGIELDGGPIPGFVLLVHFKSRDLSRLHAQGQFWHIFFIGNTGLGSAIIAQNEIDTWTTHIFLPLDTDPDRLSSEEAVYTALGGLHAPYEIKVDEILVRSTYRPNIAISRRYSGFHGHVFLAGDAAHQNIPTGGYGMNMGIADAFELGWKMAAVINGYADPRLLNSYEEERRPVALISIERSGVHLATHMHVGTILDGKAQELDSDSPEGQKLRQAIHQHYEKNHGENTDLGIEMGYRYKSSVVVRDGSKEPEWTPSRYTPTTFPGSRAPHVYLKDRSPIFDHYGRHYTLVEFSDGTDCGANLLLEAAKQQWVPIKHLLLVGEDHAHAIWERRLVLVRPDGHVAWRSDRLHESTVANGIIAVIVGLGTVSAAHGHTNGNGVAITSVNGEENHVSSQPETFTSTSGNSTQTTHFELERMGEFQA